MGSAGVGMDYSAAYTTSYSDKGISCRKDIKSGDDSISDFKAYYDATDNGVIDFEARKANGEALRDVVSEPYAEYIKNQGFIGHIYTEQEMWDNWYAKIEASQSTSVTRDSNIEPPTEVITTSSRKAGGIGAYSGNGVDLLTARYTSYVNKGQYIDPDTEETITTGYIYRTFYTEKSIVCARSGYNSKAGDIEDRFNWKVEFDSVDDYERTMDFLDRLPEGDNSIFTTREAFWQDFVNGDIDEDEFYEFYGTLDHGVANFIKQDESGNNYVDREMMSSKYFRYFGLQQVTDVPWDDLQRGLEQSALRDRGFIHEDKAQEDSVNIYDGLREAFAGSGNEGFSFHGEDEYYSIDEWIQEIIRRAHMGLAESLFPA